MNNWKTSLYGQIAYMALTGAGLLLMPQVIASLLNVEPAEEVWVRVLGTLALVLCPYYFAAIKNDARWFARVSTFGRYFFCATLTVLALVFDLPMLIALAAIEAGLAVWTHLSLRVNK